MTEPTALIVEKNPAIEALRRLIGQGDNISSLPALKFVLMHYDALAEAHARLRERVAELEASGKDKLTLLSNESMHRQHFEDRESLLLECVRWLMTCGVVRQTRNSISCEGLCRDFHIPSHLAPLIAEAVKEQKNV